MKESKLINIEVASDNVKQTIPNKNKINLKVLLLLSSLDFKIKKLVINVRIKI